MTSEEFAGNIATLITTLESQAPLIVEKMAITGKSLIMDRIVEREGVRGASYTPLYAKYKQNRYGNAGKVNLLATGRMWQGLQVTESFRSGGVFSVVLGGTDREVSRKLEANKERYGDFLQPSDEEQREIDEVAELEIDAIIKVRL